MKRAFTIVELLSCLVIIAVIAGLSFPIFSSVKRQGLKTKCVSNLHQIQVAAELYRQSESSTLDYGSAGDMGLPTLEQLIVGEKAGSKLMPARYDTEDNVWKSPCGAHPSEPKDPWVQWLPGEEPQWIEVYQRLQERAPLAYSMQCSDPTVNLRNRYQQKLLLAVQLDGSLINRMTDGLPMTSLYWK